MKEILKIHKNQISALIAIIIGLITFSLVFTVVNYFIENKEIAFNIASGVSLLVLCCIILDLIGHIFSSKEQIKCDDLKPLGIDESKSILPVLGKNDVTIPYPNDLPEKANPIKNKGDKFY